MKCFKCTVLDKEWKTCTGFVEAVSADEAKKKVKSLGYSVVSALEYAGPAVRELNTFKPEGEALTAAPEAESVLPSEREVIHPFKFLLPMGLAIALAAAAFIVYFYFFAKPPAGPDDTVDNYLQYGLAQDWDSQYGLLSRRMQDFYGSPVNYRLAVQRDWFGITTAAPEGEGAGLAYGLGITELSDTDVVVRSVLPAEGGAADFEFYMVSESGLWRIDYVRNLDRMQKRLNFLATEAGAEPSDKIIFELEQEFGLTPDELEMLLSRARIDFMQRQRQEAIDRQAILEKRRERDKQEGIVQSSFEAVEIEASGDEEPVAVFPEGDGGAGDEVQAKLEAVLAIVEDAGS